MAERTPGEKRAEFIAQARAAVRAGWSQGRFLREARRLEISFRRTDMIADWHGVAGTELKAGRFRFVRKGYTPTARVIADMPWKLSEEFMYKVKVLSRTAPGEPITERMVNIMQDRPLSPAEVEALAWEMIQAQSPRKVAEVEQITPWTVIKRI